MIESPVSWSSCISRLFEESFDDEIAQVISQDGADRYFTSNIITAILEMENIFKSMVLFRSVSHLIMIINSKEVNGCH